jgi:hypothetical protein
VNQFFCTLQKIFGSPIDNRIERRMATRAIETAENKTAMVFDQFPLEMNCEDAIELVTERIRSVGEGHRIDLDQLELPDFSSLSNAGLLQKLSELLLIPPLTECLAIAFYPLLTDLVGRWEISERTRVSVACALGRLIYIEPKLERCCLINLDSDARYVQEFVLQHPFFLNDYFQLIHVHPWEELPSQFELAVQHSVTPYFCLC